MRRAIPAQGVNLGAESDHSQARPRSARLIVAGLFEPGEYSLVHAAAEGIAIVERCDSRRDLLNVVLRRQPAGIFVPSHDVNGQSCAPILERCLEVAPSARAVMLSQTTRGAAASLLAAARLGAVAIVVSSSGDIAIAMHLLFPHD